MSSLKSYFLKQYVIYIGVLITLIACLVLLVGNDKKDIIQNLYSENLGIYKASLNARAEYLLATENHNALRKLIINTPTPSSLCSVSFLNNSGNEIYGKVFRPCSDIKTTELSIEVHSERSSLLQDSDLDMFEYGLEQSEYFLGRIDVVSADIVDEGFSFISSMKEASKYLPIPMLILTIVFFYRFKKYELLESIISDLEHKRLSSDSVPSLIKENLLFDSLINLNSSHELREEEMQLLLDKAVAESHEKSMYLAAMSHELRNPLNVVIKYNEHALNELDSSNNPKTIRKYILESMHASEILANVVNDILDKEMLDLGNLVLSDEPVDISRIIDESFSLIENAYPSIQVKLIRPEQVYLPYVASGDSNRIKQILINLLSNSVKHTNKGYIEIEYTVDDISENRCKVHFVIKDTGSGINPEMLDDIFDPYVKSDKGSGSHKSSGLGLYIAKKIVGLYDGKISIDSKIDYGTTASVTLYLQKNKSSLSYIGNAVNLDPENPELIKSVKDKRVLVVDDCAANANSIKIMLSKYPVVVKCAHSGIAAIAWLTNNKCDCIIMDVSMPGMDGHETTQIIRQRLNINAPIIAVTAHAFQQEREECIRSGMTDFQTKPVNSNKLVSAIFSHFGYNSKFNFNPSNELADPFSTIYPGVDLSEPLRTLGHDIQLIYMNLRIFVDRYGDTANSLGYLCINQEKTAAFAHKLKNDAGNIGAREIEAICVILDSEQPNADLRVNLIAELEGKLPVVVDSAKKAKTILEVWVLKEKDNGSDTGH